MMTTSNTNNKELVELLKKNNELLEKMLKIQKKDHRAQTWRTALHVFFNLLPFIIVAFLVWYLFSLVNENIQALKGNIDALKDFILGFVPDFSGMGEQLNNTWNDVGNSIQDLTFWD